MKSEAYEISNWTQRREHCDILTERVHVFVLESSHSCVSMLFWASYWSWGVLSVSMHSGQSQLIDFIPFGTDKYFAFWSYTKTNVWI